MEQTDKACYLNDSSFKSTKPKKDNTGKSFSEALILASTNPQYDKRLFIKLQVQYIKIPCSEHGENIRGFTKFGIKVA